MYNNSANSKNYYGVLQELTEKYVNSIFDGMHLDSKRNNLKDIKAVDLIVNGKKVDVQFSQNFGNYGDIRIDVISAGYYGDNWELNQNDFLSKLEFIHKIRISKVGKYFLDGYADYVVYLIYNGKIICTSEGKLPKPDGLLLLSVNEVVDYINHNIDRFVGKVKINDKKNNGISESHLSAFLPLSLEEIRSNFNDFSYNEFENNMIYYVDGIRIDMLLK